MQFWKSRQHVQVDFKVVGLAEKRTNAVRSIIREFMDAQSGFKYGGVSTDKHDRENPYDYTLITYSGEETDIEIIEKTLDYVLNYITNIVDKLDEDLYGSGQTEAPEEAYVEH